MSLNKAEIDAVLSELDLLGARIQKVFQPKTTDLVFQLYNKRNAFFLFASLEHGKTRIHSIPEKPETEIKLQRFAQFLRANIQGGVIQEVAHVHKERIVRFTITRSENTYYLYMRLWTGSGNILVTDTNGEILDAMYRKPKKNETSGEFYTPEIALENTTYKNSKTYTVRDYPGEGPLNKRIAEYYLSSEEITTKEQLKEQALRNTQKRISTLQKQLSKLRTKSDQAADAGRYKEIGDIILANAFNISPNQKWLKAPDFYHDNATVEIELDPAMNAAENAEEYYKQYKKNQAAKEHFSAEIASTEQELQKEEKNLDTIRETEEISKLREFVKQKQKQKQQKDDEQPGLRLISHGFILLVGRNAKENDQLLRKYVNGNDWWVHTRDYPGGYVFVKTPKGKTVPLEVLLDAGNLAVLYSKGKNEQNVDLYYTQVKYLRRAKNAPKGTVLPTQEKNLNITVSRERLQSVFNDNQYD
ncbi:MAG: NFACT RNA binding domain-containing protein [Spirochaetia bacterium]